jgi:hypothetical protein
VKDKDSKLIWEASQMFHSKGAREKGIAIELISIYQNWQKKPVVTPGDLGPSRQNVDKYLWPLINDKVRECYYDDDCDVYEILSHLRDQSDIVGVPFDELTAQVRHAIVIAGQ